MSDEEDYILLKWGSLKAWNITTDKGREILRKWADSCTSISAMAHHDTPEQKALLCDLIRQHEGPISNDWSGESFTKDEAIRYITEY